jgi:hypothetical protein
MVTKFTEGRHPAEMILSEANGQRSRAGILINDPGTVRPGMILKFVAATSDQAANYVPITGAGDTNLAIALYGVVTDSGQDAAISALVRDCEVNGHILEYFTGATDPNKVAIMATLAAQGIIVRN